MGKGTTTNNSSNSVSNYTPAALSGIQELYNRILSTSNTPYSPYDPNAVVAPLSATQQAGISNINTINATPGGTAQPYINQAAQYATQGAAPITQQQIQNYSNPYQSSVIDSTMAQIAQQNALQKQQLQGNSASQGGLGNERFYAAALPQLANQQGLANNQTLANLNAGNYQQSLAAAQADRAAAAQGAYTFGNLGTTAQGAQLQAAQAQIGAGGLEQQNSQALANAKLQEFMRAQGYPFQTTQYLAGLGLPALQAQGGTQAGQQTGTSNTYNPSATYGAIGGLAGGLFKGSGGRIGMEDGGAVNNLASDIEHYANGGMDRSPYDISRIESYVPSGISAPTAQMPHLQNPPPMQSPSQSGNPMRDAMQMTQAFSKIGRGIGKSTRGMFGDDGMKTSMYDAPMGYDQNTNMAGDYGNMAGDFGGGFGGGLDSFAASGGRVGSYNSGGGVNGVIEAAHHIKRALHGMPKKFQEGGGVPGDPITDYWRDWNEKNPGEYNRRSVDAFGWMAPPPGSNLTDDDFMPYKALNFMRNPVNDDIHPVVPGSVLDKGMNVNPASPDETAARLAYGRFIANQGQKYPTTPMAAAQPPAQIPMPGQQPPPTPNAAWPPPAQAAPLAPSDQEPLQPQMNAPSQMGGQRRSPFSNIVMPTNWNPETGWTQKPGINESPGGMRIGPSGVQGSDWTNGDISLGPRANYMRGQHGGIGKNLTQIDTPYGKITVNRASAPAFEGFYSDLAAAGAPINELGSFNPRKIAGSNRWSQHGYGNATDIDNSTALSSQMKSWIAENPDTWRATLQKHNMIWGGDWKNKDEPHVEWAGPESGEGSYAQAYDEDRGSSRYMDRDRGSQYAGYQPREPSLFGRMLRGAAAGYAGAGQHPNSGGIGSLLAGAGYGAGALDDQHRRDWQVQREAELLRMRAEQLKRENYHVLGTTAEGNPILFDTRTGNTRVIDQKVTAVGRGGNLPAQLQIADALVKAREEQRQINPNLPPLSREEAIMQAKKAPNDRESLAATNARADLNFLRDPQGTLNKWRSYYGLPPQVGGSIAPPNTPSQVAPTPQSGPPPTIGTIAQYTEWRKTAKVGDPFIGPDGKPHTKGPDGLPVPPIK